MSKVLERQERLAIALSTYTVDQTTDSIRTGMILQDLFRRNTKKALLINIAISWCSLTLNVVTVILSLI